MSNNISQNKYNKTKTQLPSHIQFDTVCPATKLLEKRRKMYEVHEAFEAQKDDFKKQELIFAKQEEEIRNRDLSIQENLIRFCKFLQENESKKKRAEKRLEDEAKALEQKEKEIKELDNECQKLEKQQKQLTKKVKTLKQYEQFLTNVTSQSQDYTGITEILNRHQTLEKANQNLTKEFKIIEANYDKLKETSSKYEKREIDEILQLQNGIKELIKEKEEKEAERILSLSQIEKQSQDASSQNLNLGKMLVAIDNLYSRVSQEEFKKLSFYAYEVQDFKQNNEQEQTVLGKTKLTKKQEKQLLEEQKNKEENQDKNFIQKGEDAIAQLKYVLNYMLDFNIMIETKFLKQHANIFFRTTYKQIGERTSTIKPESGNGIQGQFTDHLLYAGMYRNNSLNTICDKERYMKGAKDWMDFLN